MEGMMDKAVLDDIIRRLLEGRGGKQVQLSEGEIRQLCVNARQIFLSQPNLLEIHAPIRICGQLSITFWLPWWHKNFVELHDIEPEITILFLYIEYCYA